MNKYLFFAAALFTLAACNNDDNLPTDDPTAPVEIRLSSSIAVQTRAAHDLDEALKEGETVQVWVDDAGIGVDNPELYANNIFKAEANGALTLTEGEAMYFPSTGNAVDIYAIHGNFGADFTDFWGESITHTVEQDQRSTVTTAGDGYAVSDLVYCKSADVARTKNAVNLDFKHLLSKIEVVLVQGNGAPVIEKVEILNTQLEARFTPAKASDWTVSAAGAESENPILIDNDLTESSIAEDADKTNDALNEAIIVPQSLDGNEQFIRITTDKGGVLVYALDKATEFNAGYKYRYTITANLTGLTVTASIKPWNDGDNTPGDAEMQ